MADEALGGSPHPCCSEGAPRSKAGGSRAQGLHGCPAVVRQRIERGGDKLPATANQPSVVDAAAGDCRIGVRSPGGGSHPETSSQKYSSKLLGMSGRSRTLDDMASAVSEPVGTFVCECVCLCVCVCMCMCVCACVCPWLYFAGSEKRALLPVQCVPGHGRIGDSGTSCCCCRNLRVFMFILTHACEHGRQMCALLRRQGSRNGVAAARVRDPPGLSN